MATSPLGKLIADHYRDAPVSLRALMDEILAQEGSGRKAAKLIGIGETTWRRWKAGTTRPKAENLAKAEKAVRAVRAGGRTLSHNVTFTTWDVKDGRRRSIRGSQLGLTPASMDRVEAVYVGQGADAAAAQLVQEIRDDFYRDYFAGNDVTQGTDVGEYGGAVIGAAF